MDADVAAFDEGVDDESLFALLDTWEMPQTGDENTAGDNSATLEEQNGSNLKR